MKEEKKSSFFELVQKRVSCRSYTEKQLSEEDIKLILESARLAPSACNKQPWRFAVVRDKEVKTKLIKEGCIWGINMDWAIKAAIIIVLGMKKSLITHKIAPQISKIDYSLIDMGIVGEHIVLQATELGLGTCWIGWIKPDKIRKIVSWEKDIKPVSLITIGYPSDDSTKPKQRFPLEELVKVL